jgi:Tfp pilus assembly protein PilX
MPNQKSNFRIFKSSEPEAGVTLLLAVLILSALTLVTLAVASFAVQEIRSSRSVILSEPAINAAESGAEQGLWNFKRSASSVPDCPATAGQTLTTGTAITGYCKTAVGGTFNLASGLPTVFYLYDPASINGDIDLSGYPYSSLTITNKSTQYSMTVDIQRLDGTVVGTQTTVAANSTQTISLPAVLSGQEGRMQVTLRSSGAIAVDATTNKGLPDSLTLASTGCSAKLNQTTCNTSTSSPDIFNRKIQISFKISSNGQTPPPSPTPGGPNPPPPGDTIAPTVTAFDVEPRMAVSGATITISFTATDTGGSHLNSAQVWRATAGLTCTVTDNSGCTDWKVVATRSAPPGLDSWTSTLTDTSQGASYIYGIHVFDNAGNYGIEPSKIRVDSPVQNVAWIRAIGVTPSSNNLTKSAATGWGNAGASSNQMIGSGDGYIEFSTSENNTDKVIGLTHDDPDQGYLMEHAIYLYPTGFIRVNETSGGTYSCRYGPTSSGCATIGDTPYAANDVFRISIESGVVKYYKNGTVFYTSSVAVSTYPVLLDVSLYTANSTVTNAKISGNIILDTTAPVIASGNFDVQPRSTSGSVKATFTTTDAGFQHLQKAELWRAPYDVNNCNPASSTSGCNFGSTPVASSKAGTNLLAYNIPNTVGVSISGTPATITKTAVTGWGNAGTSSLGSISGDGYVEFNAVETNTYRMAGLSATDPDQNYTSINYAWYPAQSSLLYVMENGASKYTGSYAANDLLRIAVESGVVNYYQNGILRYTSTAAPAATLIFDSAFYDTNSTIANVKISSWISDSWSGALYDSPAPGSYVYGLHVYDNSGNQGVEPAKIAVTITAPPPTLSWTSSCGSSSQDMSVTTTKIFTVPCTYSVTVNTAMQFTFKGAGGGGGGQGAAAGYLGGYGGGGGAVTTGSTLNLAAGTTYTLVVGSAGNGTTGIGGTGGTTSFANGGTTLISLLGGTGGNSATGSPGGTASGSSLTNAISGGAGGGEGGLGSPGTAGQDIAGGAAGGGGGGPGNNGGGTAANGARGGNGSVNGGLAGAMGCPPSSGGNSTGFGGGTDPSCGGGSGGGGGGVTFTGVSGSFAAGGGGSGGSNSASSFPGGNGAPGVGVFVYNPPDTTPPTVSITAPTAGAVVSGTATSVTATASDNVGVVGVQFKLDGANLGAEDTVSPYSITWNTTTASGGSHSLTAVARDAAGNSTTSTAVSVTVDNQAPVVTAFTVTPTFTTGLVTANFSATDNLSLASAELWRADYNSSTCTSGCNWTKVNTATGNSSTSWSGSMTNTPPTGAQYLFGIHVIDGAGNVGTEGSLGTVLITSDATPPTVSITAPTAGAVVSGTATSVTATASDNVGVVGVQFKLDGANLGAEVTSSPYSVTWNTTTASGGSHTLTAVARDAAGNSTTSTAVSVTVANIAIDSTTVPQFTGVGTAANFTVSSAPNFTPPNNSLLVVAVMGDSWSTGTQTFTVSGGSLTWTKRVEQANTDATAGGTAAIWTAPVATGASMSVSIKRTEATAASGRIAGKVYIVTGYTGVDTIGAGNKNGSTINNMTTTSITPSANGLLVAVDTEWNALGTPTSSNLTYLDANTWSGQISIGSGYRAATSGVAINANFNANGIEACCDTSTNAQHKWAQIIVR